ncbi:YdcH family protein [Paracoccus sp. (in: a-proteobacteria)]|uniref:YdcH family protein n=1 Tax=Paracoccus sp. TaxID=267 RepID=UPI003A858002
MATPHSIHEEFPAAGPRIHELKLKDAHFARLLEEYDQINDQVHNAETSVTPITEEAEKGLRRKRAHLKDQIAHALTHHA